MNTYIQNYGYTNTSINNNNKINSQSLEWIGDYDGNIANINMKFNNNNTKTKLLSFQLNNQDIIDLLNIPSYNNSLEQRLVNDFFNKQSNINNYSIAELPNLAGITNKKKTKTNKKKSKKNKSKKNILQLF
jgi:hypothetical protein